MHAGQKLRFEFSKHLALIEQIEMGYIYYVPVDRGKAVEAGEDLKIWAEAGVGTRTALNVPAIEGILFSAESDACYFLGFSPHAARQSVYTLTSLMTGLGANRSRKTYVVGDEKRVVRPPVPRPAS